MLNVDEQSSHRPALSFSQIHSFSSYPPDEGQNVKTGVFSHSPGLTPARCSQQGQNQKKKRVWCWDFCFAFLQCFSVALKLFFSFLLSFKTPHSSSIHLSSLLRHPLSHSQGLQKEISIFESSPLECMKELIVFPFWTALYILTLYIVYIFFVIHMMLYVCTYMYLQHIYVCAREPWACRYIYTCTYIYVHIIYYLSWRTNTSI